MLHKFSEIIDQSLPTETFVQGTSRLDHARLGSGDAYRMIKEELDLRNKGKPNSVNDALIAEVALKNRYVLLTADFDLYQVAYAHEVGVIYWTS